MKAKLEQDLKDLKKALSQKLITVNEYCDTYHQISKKLQSL